MKALLIGATLLLVVALVTVNTVQVSTTVCLILCAIALGAGAFFERRHLRKAQTSDITRR